MEKFGKAYAEQVIRNSQTLAKALHDYRFPVICQHLGLTQSHQTILNYGGLDKGRVFAEKLQRANVITDCVVRIGTCEITRRGMKAGEMMKIAEIIKRAAVDNEPPENIKKDVAKLSLEFQKAEYCFDK
jgi:glycine hydroxymethyltransferase